MSMGEWDKVPDSAFIHSLANERGTDISLQKDLYLSIFLFLQTKRRPVRWKGIGGHSLKEPDEILLPSAHVVRHVSILLVMLLA
jgi:hypothetical protein